MHCGLVEKQARAYRLSEAAREYDGVLSELGRLYNQQPVTLVRMNYAPRDERLRAFADAFKIKR